MNSDISLKSSTYPKQVHDLVTVLFLVRVYAFFFGCVLVLIGSFGGAPLIWGSIAHLFVGGWAWKAQLALVNRRPFSRWVVPMLGIAITTVAMLQIFGLSSNESVWPAYITPFFGLAFGVVLATYSFSRTVREHCD